MIAVSRNPNSIGYLSANSSAHVKHGSILRVCKWKKSRIVGQKQPEGEGGIVASKGYVCPPSYLLVADVYLLQTHDRRGRIIDRYFDTNPSFWGQVQAVYDALGRDGMSSDETDTERTSDGPKKVRRVARVWLSNPVSAMWEKVESYHYDHAGPKAGNKAFERISAPTNSSTARAICGLPKNYYDPVWWTSLIPVDQQLLEPRDEVALPDCSVYVAHPNFYSCL